MRFKNIIIFLLLISISVQVYAQRKKNRGSLDSIKIAEAFLESENFSHAITFYQNFLEQMPNDPELNFKLGFCLLNTPTGKYKSLEYLQKSTKLYKKKKGRKSANYIESLFYLGRAYRANYEYEQSIEIFEELKSKIRNKRLLVEIEKEIKLCTVGSEVVVNPTNVSINNLGDILNSKYSDHSPVFSADESVMMFTSRRPNTSGGSPDMDGVYDENIFVSSKINGQWTEPKSISDKINTSEHEATIGLSIDGLTLLIYKGEDDGSIYMSRKIGEIWETPMKLGSNINTNYRETHASLSANGRFLYFTSDKPGGHGGLDIYMSEIQQDGTWGHAENLGVAVNSPLNEESPFIHPDGTTLYYSSEGHNTIGGYDIFKSVRNNEGNWSLPTNIGYPINTVDDDVYYLPTPDGKRAYFSSQRKKGHGSNDIYEIILKDAEGTGLTVMIGEVFVECAAVLPYSEIIVTDDETGEEGIYRANSNNGKFVFVIKKERAYTLVAFAEDKVVFMDHILIKEGSASTINYKKIRLDPKSKCDLLSNNDSITDSDSIFSLKISNILFGYDQRNFKANPGLDTLAAYLIRNPEAVIEIGAYADSKGRASYNYILSDRRANSIKYYMEKKGVDPKQLIAVGYGEENPLTYNKIKGYYNTNSQKYNRRAEFRVITQGKHILEINQIKDIPEEYKNPYYKIDYKKKDRNDIETSL